MIAFEAVFVSMIGLVLIVTIAAVARPLAEAYAEKLKVSYREQGSDEMRRIKQNLESMERQVFELKEQVKQLEETNEFASRLIESGERDSAAKPLQKKKNS